jgi:hypothetical protein
MVSITIFDSNTGHVVQVTAVDQSMSLKFDADSAFSLAVERARNDFPTYAQALPRTPRAITSGTRDFDDDRRRSCWLGGLLDR